MTQLSELQSTIESIRAERGFTTDPVQMLTLLVEEVGEVASELKKTWSPNYPDLVVADLADELADVFTLVSALASRFEIDLEAAVARKFVEADGARAWQTMSDRASDSNGDADS